jgi:hypothetical protein
MDYHISDISMYKHLTWLSTKFHLQERDYLNNQSIIMVVFALGNPGNNLDL